MSPKHKDPFRPLHFLGCLTVVAVVILTVAVGLETFIRLTLP